MDQSVSFCPQLILEHPRVRFVGFEVDQEASLFSIVDDNQQTRQVGVNNGQALIVNELHGIRTVGKKTTRFIMQQNLTNRESLA